MTWVYSLQYRRCDDWKTERFDEIPSSWVEKANYLWRCFHLCISLIITCWLPKAIEETNCFGMAVAVGGHTLHIGRPNEMRIWTLWEYICASDYGNEALQDDITIPKYLVCHFVVTGPSVCLCVYWAVSEGDHENSYCTASTSWTSQRLSWATWTHVCVRRFKIDQSVVEWVSSLWKWL